MSWRFNSTTIFSENDKEAILRCRLDGFKPSKHTSKAYVTDNVLHIEASMDGKDYGFKVKDIGVDSHSVVAKPSKGQIDVVIKKPSAEYSLASKLPK